MIASRATPTFLKCSRRDFARFCGPILAEVTISCHFRLLDSARGTSHAPESGRDGQTVRPGAEMGPTDARAQPRALQKLWPAYSRAKVVFPVGEQYQVESAARRLFGNTLRAWEYSGIAGAPDDATVELSAYHDELSIEVSDPPAGRYRGFLYVRRAGKGLVIVKAGFHIHVQSMQRKGLGLRIFHRQLENARNLGVRRIEIVAGRRDDENGYYTWPRFGFNGLLPNYIKRQLPVGLDHASTVLDLMESEGGRLWWKRYGKTIELAFDMADDSRSRRVFGRYVRERMGLGCGVERPSSDQCCQ